MAQVTELQISRGDRWSSTQGVMAGKVTIESTEGKQEIRLSAASIAKIFDVVRLQVSETAKKNAGDVHSAVAEASSECGLLENQKVIEGEKA